MVIVEAFPLKEEKVTDHLATRSLVCDAFGLGVSDLLFRASFFLPGAILLFFYFFFY